MKHSFKKTYVFNGQEHNDLELDVEKLTVLDYELAEAQFKSLNRGFVGAIELESGFIKQIMINTAKKPLEFFNGLPAHEFITLKNEVLGFLMGM